SKGENPTVRLPASSTTSAWERSSPRWARKSTTPPKQKAPVEKCRSIGSLRTYILNSTHHPRLKMKLLVLSILLTLFSGAQESFAQQKFLMGYSSFSANQTPIWVAKEEGLFKRFGTDPDLILIEGGTRG